MNILFIDIDKFVVFVGNLLYGERIGDCEEVEEMYCYIGIFLK